MRFILIGPTPTLEALHEKLRNITNPFVRIVGIHSDHTLFSRRWYATVDLAPNFVVPAEFEQSSDEYTSDFEGYTPGMA